MKKTVIIKSQFGHEIMAVNFAKAFDLNVVIVPNKDEKEAYEEEAQKIFQNMILIVRKPILWKNN